MRIDIKYPERFTAIFETVTGNKLYHPVLGITTDSREIQENDLYITLIGERVDGHSFLGNVENSGATAALVSQIDESLGLQQIVCDNPLIMIGNIANAWRKQFDIPVIGITGSNGKTSTKDFVKWHLDWFNQKGALEIDYTPSDKIKMFFNEFSKNTFRISTFIRTRLLLIRKSTRT